MMLPPRVGRVSLNRLSASLVQDGSAGMGNYWRANAVGMHGMVYFEHRRGYLSATRNLPKPAGACREIARFPRKDIAGIAFLRRPASHRGLQPFICKCGSSPEPCEVNARLWRSLAQDFVPMLSMSARSVRNHKPQVTSYFHD